MAYSGLKMDASFGIPDAMLKAIQEVKAARGSGRKSMMYDASVSNEQAIQAHSLLTPSLYAMLTQLSDQGATALDIAYSFDRAVGARTTPGLQVTSCVYPSVSTSQRCAWTLADNAVGAVAVSGDEARKAVESHAMSVNHNVSIGEGTEMLHWMLATSGAELRMLLTSMWLLHLDVVAGTFPRVQRGAAALRGNLASADVRDECEEAKALQGVRMHVNALDQVGQALLVASCDRQTMTGASPRVTRHVWPVTEVVFYGGRLARDLDVRLDSPMATVRAIVTFAERFGAQTECGQALASALWMYGTPTVPKKLELLVKKPCLHDAVHAPNERNGSVWHCRELTSLDLVGLAKFVGLGLNQVCGHVLRKVTHSLNEADVDGVEAFIARNHTSRVRSAGLQLQRQLATKAPVIFSFPSLLSGHVASLWRTQGVSHALLFGVVVDGTLLSEVTERFVVPTGQEVAITDNPCGGDGARDAGARLFLASELLQDCAAAQNHTIRALTRDMPGTAQASAAVTIHQGCEVQLVVVGVNGPRNIEKLAKSGWALGPAPGVLTGTIESGMAEVDVAHEELPVKATYSELPQEILTARGPRVATRLVPTRPKPVTEPPRPNQHVIASVDALGAKALEPVLRAGWGPQPTSGEGALCGANALHQSLEAQGSQLGEFALARDEVVTAVRTVMPEYADPGHTGRILQSQDNFTADQLSAVANTMGLTLGVVDQHPDTGQLRAYTIGAPTGAVVWLHHAHNHWSSVGPSQNPFHMDAT